MMIQSLFRQLLVVFLLNAGTDALPDEECKYALELLLLQDGSSSFETHIDEMSDFMASLMSKLEVEYPELKLGVSSFVDKPIPFRGFGNYGNWNPSIPDYCYKGHAPLTTDTESIVSGLRELSDNLGAGNDFSENPFEGLMIAAADSSVGWSPVDVTHSAEGRPIIRLILLITDDLPHMPGDATGATRWNWNWPRGYEEGVCIGGGFGAPTYLNFAGGVNYENEAEWDEYMEMAGLFHKVDHDVLLSSSEESRLDTLISKFGPYPYPEPVDPHPGNVDIQCEDVEYPSPEQVGAFLKKQKIIPVFLLADPTGISNDHKKACDKIMMAPGKECLVELYKGYSHQMNMDNVVDKIDGEHTENTILEAIKTMTDLACIYAETTTTPLPTETIVETTTIDTTTSTETTTESITSEATAPLNSEEPTGAAELTASAHHGASSTEVEISVASSQRTDEDNSEVVLPPPVITKPSGTKPVTSEVSDTELNDTNHVSTRVAGKKTTTSRTTDLLQSETQSASTEGAKSRQPSTSSTTGSESGSDLDGHTGTTDEGAVVPPVVPPPGGDGDSSTDDGEDGPNIGVIAGASAGAVAGVAAAAGAFAKFGGGMFGGANAEGLEAIQQVETPDSPIERETMEQVTMEMFQ